MKLSSKLVR